MKLKLEAIKVNERIREDIGTDELDELASSMLALGQLQPAVVEMSNNGIYSLIAGERRLRAIQKLNAQGKSPKDLEVGFINVEVQGELSTHVRLMVEFDENVKRKDFSFVEKARFIRKFHEALRDRSGGKWTAEMTAASLRLSPASISHYLRIEEAMQTDDLVAKATTMKSAVKRMQITEKTRARTIEAKENVEDTSYLRAKDVLLLGNALELIKTIPDASIDFINFDPPWGDDVGHKSNENWEGFDDSTATSDSIINTLLPELFRVLKDDRAMVYWYRTWAYADMIERLESAGFNLKFTRTPCIWFKPDKVSDQNRFPEKQLLSTYETFLIARKGEPLLHERNKQDVFVFDRVPRANLIHPTEKPIPLCNALLKLFSISGEKVLDPTAGSSAMLDAAIRMDRRPIGFELSEAFHERGLLRIAAALKERGTV